MIAKIEMSKNAISMKFNTTIISSSQLFSNNIEQLIIESEKIQFLFADIVNSNKSVLFVQKKDDFYQFSYTRPLAISPINSYLFDYYLKFRLTIEENKINIIGHIGIKPLVAFLLLVILLLTVLEIISTWNNPITTFDYLFLLIIPSVFAYLLCKEYIAFKKRMVLLLNDIGKR